jgi:hypothetical protein
MYAGAERHLSTDYPQNVGIILDLSSRSRYFDPWSKLYERYSVSTGHHDTQSPAQWEDADQDPTSWRVRYNGTENLAAFRILIHHHKMRGDLGRTAQRRSDGLLAALRGDLCSIRYMDFGENTPSTHSGE